MNVVQMGLNYAYFFRYAINAGYFKFLSHCAFIIKGLEKCKCSKYFFADFRRLKNDQLICLPSSRKHLRKVNR